MRVNRLFITRPLGGQKFDGGKDRKEFIMNVIITLIKVMFLYPLGNLILGILVTLAIGIPIYKGQDSLGWLIIGIVIAIVGIVRLIIYFITDVMGK
jgi:hypothetical protein